MAEIQSQKRNTNDGASPHCPYCRDELSEGVIVECDQCQACYHKECVSSCVILGCQGALRVPATSGLNGSIHVREVAPDQALSTEARRARDRENSSHISSLIFLVVGAGFLGLLALAAMGKEAAGFTLMVLLVLFSCAAMLLGFMAALGWGSPKTSTKVKIEDQASAKLEKPSRDNFYAKPNIAPPSNDPLRPDS